MVTMPLGNGFMPHGYCFLWQPGILWLHVLSDLGIALAYFCIPAILVYFIRKRPDLPFRRVFWLFGAFILLCGLTHLLSIWVLWHPDYLFEGLVKALTAAASIATTVALVFVIPAALDIAGPAQMAEANSQLKALYEQTLERGRVTLSAVVDNVLDGIITIDEKGHIESFNKACTTIFGYRPEEVMGQNIKMLMPEPYHAEHDGYLSSYVTTGAAKIIGTSGREVRARRKDGAIFPMDLAVSAVTIDGVRHFSGIIRDITVLKAAEEARERLLVRLTESNTELERFAYVASHDMQEPVRMVLNFSQVIIRDYGKLLDENGKEYLNIISDSAMRMRDMVRDLLAYARLGHEGMNFAEVDLAVELTHVLKNLSQLISDTGAVITFDALPKLHGNAVQLMRLMQNLIANAIKYQPAGQLAAVHIGVTGDCDNWQFTVKDNGLGIAEQFVTEIFEPFRRLHNWEAIQGTGLGLSVCRKIAENHGGRIWATSTAGEGSTIFFTINGLSVQA